MWEAFGAWVRNGLTIEAFNGKIVKSLSIMFTADNEDSVFEITIRHCRFSFCDPLRDNKN